MASIYKWTFLLLAAVAGIFVLDDCYFSRSSRALARYAALSVFVFALLLWCRSRSPRLAKRFFPPVLYALVFVAAFAESAVVLVKRHAPIAFGNVAVHAEIVEASRLGEGTWRFLAERTDPPRSRFQVKWQALPNTPLPPLHSRLWISARLYPPPVYHNKGVSNGRQALARKGILATGTLLDWKGVEGVRSTPSILDAFKAQLSHTLGTLPKSDERAFLYALVLGRVDELSPEMRRNWQFLGIYHLLVVSGLHLGIFFWLSYGVGNWLASRVAVLWKRRVRQDLALLVGMAGAIVPVLFYPPTPSLKRAFWAIVAASCYRLLRVPIRPGLLALLVCAAFLITDPFLVFDLSFQMTFICVFSILLLGLPLADAMKRGLGKNRLSGFFGTAIDIWAASVAVLLGLAPVVGMLQGRICLSSFGLNLVLVPLFGTVMTPLFAVITAFGESMPVLLDGVYRGLHGVFWGINWVYTHCAVSLLTPFIHPLLSLFYWASLAAVAVLGSHRNRLLSLGVLFFLGGVLLVYPVLIRPSGLSVTMFDVGQGESLLVQTPHGKAYLIDAAGLAGLKSKRFDIGERVLVPALLARGVRTIDAILLTHADPDHFLGLKAVLQTFSVKEFWWNGEEGRDARFGELLQMVKAEGIPIKRLSAHTPSIALDDGVHLDILYPRLPPGAKYLGNNYSLVTRLRHKAVSFLLTGDIERLAELGLLYSDQARFLPSDVLKVPHHGSRTSSSTAFLDRVAPRLAIASMGRENIFGHPHPEIVARYAERHIPLLRTDLHGQITITTDGYAIKTEVFLKSTSENPFRHRERNEVKRGDPVNSMGYNWMATSLRSSP